MGYGKICKIKNHNPSESCLFGRIQITAMRTLLLHSSLIMIIILVSCTSLSTVNSIDENNSKTAIYKNYDAASQIKYLVSNDDQNLHLSLKTNHRPTIAKILRAGLTIYFDSEGKKKKNVYVKYPLESPQDLNQLKGNGGPKKPDYLKSLIHATSVGAEYGFFDQKQSFVITNPNTDIQISLQTNSEKELVYDLIIPFKKLSTNGRADLSNLSIGIVTGSFDIPSSRPQMTQDRGGSSREGIGIPQQGYATGNANYSGGGQRGGRSGRPPHEGFSELSQDSKIWFLVALYR